MKILLLLSMLSLCVEATLVVNEPTITVYETKEIGGHIEDIIRYGTAVEITDEEGMWAHIKYPGWHGWVLKDKLLEVKEDPQANSNAIVGFRGAYLFKVADTEYGPILSLPFEAPIKVIEELPEAHQRWVIVELQDGQKGYMQRSQIVFSPEKMNMEEAACFSKQFLGTKYLWGGTSSFGYDCSGFVQMLFRQMGITIPRNSNIQAADTRFQEVDPEDAKLGDLVFFKNASGKVVHVGMMINDKEFIHAFTKQESWICISELKDERFRNGYFYYGTSLKRFVK